MGELDIGEFTKLEDLVFGLLVFLRKLPATDAA
jgi:hypothetical protein